MTLPLYGIGAVELAFIVGVLICLAAPAGGALLVIYLALRNRRD